MIFGNSQKSLEARAEFAVRLGIGIEGHPVDNSSLMVPLKSTALRKAEHIFYEFETYYQKIAGQYICLVASAETDAMLHQDENFARDLDHLRIEYEKAIRRIGKLKHGHFEDLGIGQLIYIKERVLDYLSNHFKQCLWPNEN